MQIDNKNFNTLYISLGKIAVMLLSISYSWVSTAENSIPINSIPVNNLPTKNVTQGNHLNNEHYAINTTNQEARNTIFNSSMPREQQSIPKAYFSDKKKQSKNNPWYVGAGVGFSDASPKNLQNGWENDSTQNSDTAFQIFGGKNLSDRIFIEGSYTNLGLSNLNNIQPSVNREYPDAAVKLSTLAATAGIRLFEQNARFNISLRGTINRLTNNAVYENDTSNVNKAKSNAFGLGVSADLAITPKITSRISVDSIDNDAWYAMASLIHNFGSTNMHKSKYKESSLQALKETPTIDIIQPVTSPFQIDKNITSLPTKTHNKQETFGETIYFKQGISDLTPIQIAKIKHTLSYLNDVQIVNIQFGIDEHNKVVEKARITSISNALLETNDIQNISLLLKSNPISNLSYVENGKKEQTNIYNKPNTVRLFITVNM